MGEEPLRALQPGLHMGLGEDMAGVWLVRPPLHILSQNLPNLSLAHAQLPGSLPQMGFLVHGEELLYSFNILLGDCGLARWRLGPGLTPICLKPVNKPLKAM